MSDLNADSPKSVLTQGWFASVGDYAIAGGWILRGEALVAGDAGGGVYAFDGESGAAAWERPGVHEGGVLAVAIHPSGSAFATAGQDGRALIWNAAEGQVSRGHRSRKRLGGKRGVVAGRQTVGGLLLPAGLRV